ncbi:MAG: hypothetical protein WA125_00830 [Desulfosporosinus sp.]
MTLQGGGIGGGQPITKDNANAKDKDNAKDNANAKRIKCIDVILKGSPD